jgi:hypothetical protein
MQQKDSNRATAHVEHVYSTRGATYATRTSKNSLRSIRIVEHTPQNGFFA